MNILQVALGIITGIGGFLEVGSMATAVDAGASFRFQLIWAIVVGTVCLTFLIEMAGRLAAVSKHSLADAVRERFGFNFTVIPRLLEVFVNFAVLSAEIGGVALSIRFVTGIPVRALAMPIALVAWFVVWIGTLDIVENATAILGLVTISFVVAVFKLHPAPAEVVNAVVPTIPQHDAAHYWFVAISILGATISPYMFHFYSSGAIEEKWDEKSLSTNRLTAAVGMGFGSLVAIAVLVTAGCVFAPHQIHIESYSQIALMLTPIFGAWGVRLFALSLGVCCFGAAVEIALGTAYMLSQTFGWNWGEDEKPQREARFTAAYSLMLIGAGALLLTGVDPLKLTMYAMAITAAILPLVVIPFLILLNDPSYLKDHCNGPIGNTVVVVTVILSSIVALVTVPLQILGGG